MKNYTLGTIEASEQLITDLYVDLRNKVNTWAAITLQTPQARMGYIGQHLVSVVTGYTGGKTGARGVDLVIDNEKYGEIKTCYRVDQLGVCGDCGAAVSILEKECSKCASTNIIRKDDSKWLIGIHNAREFLEILDPYRYYFVLFEFENFSEPQNTNIISSIWEVNPRVKGFGYCMMDYYVNIRIKSASKAPFNMWPYSIKFALTQPKLIYKSIIYDDGNIKTLIFPTLHNGYVDAIRPLTEYSKASTITVEAIKTVLSHYDLHINIQGKSKTTLLEMLENIRIKNNILNSEICDLFSDAIYLPLLMPKKIDLPQHLVQYYPALQLS